MNIVFLMIARVLYDKGYQEYVDAAKIIKQKYAGIEFQLLGSIDPVYPNCVPKTIVEKDSHEGYIKYLGETKNVQPFIQTADCIVLPSYHEGLSRVLIESLAMGKPIITTDIPGCRETVECGKNGYLVPPRNSHALADAILKFVNLSSEERKQMGLYGRMKAEKEFDVKNVIAVYKQITHGI